MENTPFDSPPRIEAQLPPSHPQHSPFDPPKPKPKWPVLLLLLVPLLGAGSYFWSQHQAQQAEDARLAVIRQKLKILVMQDNALALEMLETDKSSNITYAEYFKRAENNKEERDDLVRQVRATEADIYAPQAQKFVELMDLENEWVRADEALTKAQMEFGSKAEAFREAVAKRDGAQNELEGATKDYYAAPYGEDYDEKFKMLSAQSSASLAQSGTETAFTEFKTAKRTLGEREGAASLAIKEWLDKERTHYPHVFAPPRDVISLLQKRRTKLRSQGGDSAPASPVSPDDAKSPAVEVSTSGDDLPSNAAPEATPTPSVPTRLRSTSPFEGERFPQTRMEDLLPVDAYNLSDDDLQYAINEMFARYGMTFRDKDFQANFEGYKWYRPNDSFTMGQIERAFSKREKANLKVLTDERRNRRSGE